MQFLDNLKWRYATKKFDPLKKVSQQNIDYIKEAVRLSASSYGLQPYKVLEIKNSELREELKQASWNQSQITDASHLFVFCNYLNVSNDYVDEFILLKSKINEINIEKIHGYGDFIKGKLKEKSGEDIKYWTAKQTYIALSNAMNACADLQIDCTPMEGFESDVFNKKLYLSSKGLKACVLLAVGYRHKDDETQNAKKVRKSIKDIFQKV
jgi:nitroreductase